MAGGYLWWQKGVIYQIYPRSFQDSNNDGIGDLPGITQRLDYLASLGIDAIWISPIYPSPMADFGYDVADYVGIHPMFGTMADFDRLLAEAHQRGLKVLLDLVPNHTSHQHPWFVESRSSRDNPKRDWYIWRDPAPDGGPPNNWLSVFGGPAWTFDPQTGQYYFHQFLKEQPELNFRNPAVLPAILDVMRFWLDKGVDGFRVDVLYRLFKDAQFRDEPPDPDWNGVRLYDSLLHIYTKHQPELHSVVRQMRALMDSYGERVMVGETYAPNDILVTYYGKNLDECHLPFNFQLIRLPWSAAAVRQAVNDYEAVLPPGAWPNWVLGNHDQPRIATRAGAAQARVAAMFLLTIRGTPTMYYGDEIGMENVPIPPEYIQDPPALLQPEIAHIVGRDPERTPMQWDSSPNAGFSAAGVRTWLPIAADYKQRNVAIQEKDPASLLNLYRALLRVRRAQPALSVGSYTCVDAGHDDIYAYLRTGPDGGRFLVVLNFGSEGHVLDLSSVAHHAEITLATDMTRSGRVELTRLHLGGNEGLLLRL